MPVMLQIMLICSVLLLAPSLLIAQDGGLAAANSWLETHLADSQTSPLSYVFLFLGGIVASLLPCTYPLYPITANIIRSRSEHEKKTLLHPIMYYSGMASMYFIFGVIATTSGGAFNSVLRLPLTNVLIAALMLLMGLSAAGLVNLPLFHGTAGGAGRQGITGTFLLGMGAGLLASSCVGPVVVSILLVLASQAAGGFSVGIAFLSAAKMFAFGLGLGVPFLLIGVFGVKLPKSGSWMTAVQYALALLIVYFSYTYLEKGLAGYGFAPEQIQMVFWGTLSVLAAAYFFQSTTILSLERMNRALWALAGVVGIALLLRGTAPTASLVATPLTNSATGTNTASALIEREGQLSWNLRKEAAYAVAKAEGKKVFIDFYAHWCANCKAFKENTKNSPAFQATLNNAVLLKIYDTDPQFEAYKNDPRFPELKVGLPFFVITDADGNLLYKTNDYLKTDEMTLFLSE
jgi:thiol:disulfide interchange protein DsbD